MSFAHSMWFHCMLTPSGCSPIAENKRVRRPRPCAPFPPGLLFVLRGVVGRHEFVETTAITQRLNVWALLMHLPSRFGSSQHTNRGALLHACGRVPSRDFSAAECSWFTVGRESTPEELPQTCDVAGIFSWLGSGEPVRTALILVQGGDQPLFP